VFDRYEASVERVLRRLLGRDLEDCLQEVFVDVLRGLAGFEGRAALSTWVYRVALRRGWKCLAERRRHRAHGRRGDDDDIPVEQVPARSASVVEHLETAELACRFEQALERLDLEQRTVLAMSAAQGLGPPEIAAVLGVPVGTVHSRLHRARERMRELLGIE